MTTTYILTAVLILAVVRQLRGRKLAGASLYVPLGVAVYAAVEYLRTIPTSGNNSALIALGVAVGLALGVLCAFHTVVYRDASGTPWARATTAAAVFWIAGVTGRLAFALYAQHGGGPTLAHFSVAHQLTAQGWIAALVLMALVEVLSRTVVLVVRSRPGEIMAA